jgi:tetratricopeptide (TPR) repeat protein
LTESTSASTGRPLLTNVPQPAEVQKAPEPAPEPDEKMSGPEIQRMLEWARRTAEGGRITAPPGDNLKELLARVDKADPGNAEATALRARTANVLGRKSAIALKKQRLDEAVQSLGEMLELKPDDDWAKPRLERALRLRAEKLLEKHKPIAAVNDANAALEINPDDVPARLVLADAYLAQSKYDQAADEYQRVLEGRPADKRAKKGLLLAKAAPKATKKKKH